MIQHGDIRTGADIGVCRLHLSSFMEGKLGFRSRIEQQGDQKQFEGIIPPEAMAVGRVSNRFVEEYQETPPQQDYLAYYDKRQQEYRSTTGQFVWNVKERGYFTMQTPCSRAAVGFNAGKELALGNIRYRLDQQNPFAVMLLTSLEKGVSLDETSRAFVTLVSRARNTGMSYDDQSSRLINKGKAPLLMESVSARLRLPRPARIHLLDHRGMRTGKEIKPVKGNIFYLDGSNGTIYYEIEYL